MRMNDAPLLNRNIRLGLGWPLPSSDPIVSKALSSN